MVRRLDLNLVTTLTCAPAEKVAQRWGDRLLRDRVPFRDIVRRRVGLALSHTCVLGYVLSDEHQADDQKCQR